jgi:hypothetical protein
MTGKRRMVAGLVLASAATTLAVSTLAGASSPGGAPVSIAAPR